MAQFFQTRWWSRAILVQPAAAFARRDDDRRRRLRPSHAEREAALFCPALRTVPRSKRWRTSAARRFPARIQTGRDFRARLSCTGQQRRARGERQPFDLALLAAPYHLSGGTSLRPRRGEAAQRPRFVTKMLSVRRATLIVALLAEADERSSSFLARYLAHPRMLVVSATRSLDRRREAEISRRSSAI